MKKSGTYTAKESRKRFEAALKGARLVSPIAYEDTKKAKPIPPKSPKGRKSKFN